MTHPLNKEPQVVVAQGIQEKLEQIARKAAEPLLMSVYGNRTSGLDRIRAEWVQVFLSAIVEARGIKEPGADTKRLDWLEDRDCDWRSLEFSDQGLRFAIDSELNRYSEPDQE